MSSATTVRVTILAFAAAREALGTARLGVDAAAQSTVGELWNRLAGEHAALEPLRSSVRFARNGRVVPASAAIEMDDEIAILPPVGGG